MTYTPELWIPKNTRYSGTVYKIKLNYKLLMILFSRSLEISILGFQEIANKDITCDGKPVCIQVMNEHHKGIFISFYLGTNKL